MVKRYDHMAGTTSPLLDDWVVTVMIALCSKDLREHLELCTKDMKLIEIREEILNYVERKRTSVNEDVVAVEIDALKKKEEAYHLCGNHAQGFYDYWEGQYYDGGGRRPTT